VNQVLGGEDLSKLLGLEIACSALAKALRPSNNALLATQCVVMKTFALPRKPQPSFRGKIPLQLLERRPPGKNLPR
jgi:hypothetical protein